MYVSTSIEDIQSWEFVMAIKEYERTTYFLKLLLLSTWQHNVVDVFFSVKKYFWDHDEKNFILDLYYGRIITLKSTSIKISIFKSFL